MNVTRRQLLLSGASTTALAPIFAPLILRAQGVQPVQPGTASTTCSAVNRLLHDVDFYGGASGFGLGYLASNVDQVVADLTNSNCIGPLASSVNQTANTYPNLLQLSPQTASQCQAAAPIYGFGAITSEAFNWNSNASPSLSNVSIVQDVATLARMGWSLSHSLRVLAGTVPYTYGRNRNQRSPFRDAVYHSSQSSLLFRRVSGSGNKLPSQTAVQNAQTAAAVGGVMVGGGAAMIAGSAITGTIIGDRSCGNSRCPFNRRYGFGCCWYFPCSVLCLALVLCR